jgi:hypothetical protein
VLNEKIQALSINQIAYAAKSESFHRRFFEEIMGKAELDLARCVERSNPFGWQFDIHNSDVRFQLLEPPCADDRNDRRFPMAQPGAAEELSQRS